MQQKHWAYLAIAAAILVVQYVWRLDNDTVQLQPEARSTSQVFVSNVPIDNAARNGEFAAVVRLLDQGADPDQQNTAGYVALTGAAGKCTDPHLEIMGVLIQHGADINRQALDGSTAIDNAAYWGCEENVKLLIDSGADVNVTKLNGFSPLISAASAGHKSIAERLLEADAEPDRQTSGGSTALHMASANGHDGIVVLLLEHNARTDILNGRGETFIDVHNRTTDGATD